MAACYCLTWTCIRTDTFISVRVYSSAVTFLQSSNRREDLLHFPTELQNTIKSDSERFLFVLLVYIYDIFSVPIKQTCLETSRKQRSSLNRQSAALGTHWCRRPLSPQRTGLIWISARGSMMRYGLQSRSMAPWQLTAAASPWLQGCYLKSRPHS